MPSDDLTAEQPFVSVVMPALNEEKYIGRCLASLLNTDYPADRVEFIIVDGCSVDLTAEIVFAHTATDPRIRLLTNPKRTAPIAMNIGIRAARGEVIIRVDAHSEYPPDYIRLCVETLERTGAANVGGVWRTNPGSTSVFGRAIALALTHRFGVGNSAFRLGGDEGYVDTVPFGAFRRSVFDKVGLFHEALTRHQDYELNARIRSCGGGVYQNPRIWCDYYSRPNLWALWRQKFLDGKWNAYSWNVRPDAMARRHLVPGIVAAIALALAAVSPFSVAAFAALGLCGGTYATAALLASASLFRRSSDIAAWFCPAAFFTLHFGHGFGLIWGLATMRRWVRNQWKFVEPPELKSLPDRVVVQEAA